MGRGKRNLPENNTVSESAEVSKPVVSATATGSDSSLSFQSPQAPEDLNKRRFLTAATSVLGGFGVLAALFPFVAAWRPSERVKALGGPVTVDLTDMAPGDRKTIEWRGKPIWIIRRSPEMLQSLTSVNAELRDPNSRDSTQPSYATNEYRAIQEEFLVLIGVCTHLGCSPTYRPKPGVLGESWPGGFFCPCHGSSFDLAGRVFKGVPAPKNMAVPPYHFASASEIVIGEDPENV